MKIRLTLALMLTSSALAHAQSSAIGFDTSRFWTSETGAGVFGWDFSVKAPIRITAVGIYDNPNLALGGIPGDGIVVSHSIGIWRAAAGAPIVSATLAAGAATLVDGFRYTPVGGGIELQPGTQYVIGALYDGGNNEVMVDTVNNPTLGLTVNSAITLGSRRWINGSALEFPSNVSTTENAFGANFLFEPAPEPTAWALLIAAGVAFSIRSMACHGRVAPICSFQSRGWSRS